MSKKIKVGMISLGCPKNLVDSEVMLGLMQKDGYELTHDQDQADVMVVNTCAFIEESKQESVDTILETAALKENGKLQKLIVTGCLAQRYKAKLERELPEVDHFVGTGEFQNISQFLPSASKTQLPMARSQVRKPEFVYDYATPRLSTLPPHTAYVKIAEGCSRDCSFCIIPKLRGQGRSRSIVSIEKEVLQLVEQGTKEIHLIAQDLTDYGHDRGDGADLLGLLRVLVQIEGLEWIRLMYNYPQYFSSELVDLIASSPKICSYVDMPLQHIDSDLLASMNRETDEVQTMELLDELRAKIPGLVLRTTLIVGFPGETQEQFEKLLSFVEKVQFDRLGVFTYSPEEGTPAALMPNQIEEAVKEDRKDQIMRLQQSISASKNQSLLGSTQKIIIDRKLDQGPFAFVGRTEGQALDIDGNVWIESGNYQVGQIISEKIADVSEYDLFV
ncbi:MAG: 30S ribosomal protein S12 methylthiotransferase RimO [Bdellovibrionales bacterium]|nr:30S ribosomal protein S12 methylthiotransferase RimO [Bdellovibrionales bacterium]